jgi:hypothetical protein
MTAKNVSLESFENMRIIMRSISDPVWFIENVLEQPLWPAQREMIRNFYRYKYKRGAKPFKRCVLAWGQRSGKTAMMACIGLYEMFEICCIENPSKHYGLIKDQIIMIAVLSPSEDQTLRGVYGNMVNYVDNCSFLKDFMGWEASKKAIYSPSKKVRIEPFGSWAHTGRGTTAKAVIFDEMDYFEETTNRRGGQEVYTAMANATTTLGDDAHVFVISSLKSSVSTVSRMLTDAAIEAQTVGYDNTSTYTECKPTWDINPNISFDDCKKICNNNMIELWRNFGCKPSVYSSMTFPNGVELKTMTNVLNPLVAPQHFRPRVMAIDPALKNDAFGLAVGYRGEDGIIHVDGVLKYRKREGDITISPKEIKGFVKKAITLLGVGTLIYDIYMFPDILEMAESMGVMTQQHIVRKADYDTLRSLMEQKMCDVVYDAELKKEFEELENKSEKRCDHPLHGGKDAADCVANIAWFLTTNEPIDLVNNFVSVSTF